MARLPKSASIPVPMRGGRKAKAGATPPEPIIGEGSGALEVETVGAEAVTDGMVEQPVRGRQGRPPKQRVGTAISSVFQSDAEQQLVADVDPLEAATGPAPAEDDALTAEVADPVSARKDSDAPSSDAMPSAPGRDGAVPEKPAARWDRATDTVRFDWAEIQRTALQNGPNQAMAKLLVAARAEGANSRWPL